MHNAANRRLRQDLAQDCSGHTGCAGGIAEDASQDRPFTAREAGRFLHIPNSTLDRWLLKGLLCVQGGGGPGRDYRLRFNDLVCADVLKTLRQLGGKSRVIAAIASQLQAYDFSARPPGHLAITPDAVFWLQGATQVAAKGKKVRFHSLEGLCESLSHFEDNQRRRDGHDVREWVTENFEQSGGAL